MYVLVQDSNETAQLSNECDVNDDDDDDDLKVHLIFC